MKSILLASALLLSAGAAIPAFAADPMPEKAKPMPMHHMHSMHGMHSMHAGKGAMMARPAREKSTDELNQQQLDKGKS